MAWTFNNQFTKPVVKCQGKCSNHSQHKFCPYWMAKHSLENKRIVVGYKCSLFQKDKTGYNSLSECNDRYGETYQGKP